MALRSPPLRPSLSAGASQGRFTPLPAEPPAPACTLLDIVKHDRSARVIIAGRGFVQNPRRGPYELAAEELVTRHAAVAFDELADAI